MLRLLFTLALLPASLRAQSLQNGTTFSDTTPAGAPTVTCTVPTQRDAAKLLVVKGNTPVEYVFACGENRPAGKCVTMNAAPGSRDLPVTLRFATSGEQQNGWSCVSDSEGIRGWIRSDRLQRLPDTLAITTADWLGWWQQGKDTPGYKNDRLLITRSKSDPKMLHVSGRAYWYGANNNVHFGGVDADASAYSDTLRVVDGDATRACTIDFVYHPATHTVSAIDNQGCGGMNVRFSGDWRRFQPTSTKHHRT